jgi:1-deoxy-D-xylulose-5-phosphate reductoisomerase
VRGVAVLGATGSIGRQSLAVLAQHPERFRLTSLSAGRDVAGLAALALQWRPALVVIADPALEAELRALLAPKAPRIRVASGPQALVEAATESAAEVVIAAIVGAAGLPSTLAAASHGKTLLLANKEALVVAGGLILSAAKASGARLLPLDSEHNALFQCLPEGKPDAGVDRLWLTASGGPFLDWTAEAMAQATPEQAVAHPNWKMGAKISVDSATLMNKGLEVIEAERLFALGADRIGVLIHPQSVLHAMVEYIDGSFIAHLGAPDMRIPIAHALGWPERLRIDAPRLDLAAVAGLSFQRPDLARFPCLRLAFEALRGGPVAPIVLNAANEVAVAAFLDRQLPFSAIAGVVEAALSQLPVSSASTLDEVLALDQHARQLARSVLPGHQTRLHA